jgi:hypothetical protein
MNATEHERAVAEYTDALRDRLLAMGVLKAADANDGAVCTYTGKRCCDNDCESCQWHERPEVKP